MLHSIIFSKNRPGPARYFPFGPARAGPEHHWLNCNARELFLLFFFFFDKISEPGPARLAREHHSFARTIFLLAAEEMEKRDAVYNKRTHFDATQYKVMVTVKWTVIGHRMPVHFATTEWRSTDQ
jgi:hypothetical protein